MDSVHSSEAMVGAVVRKWSWKGRLWYRTNHASFTLAGVVCLVTWVTGRFLDRMFHRKTSPDKTIV